MEAKRQKLTNENSLPSNNDAAVLNAVFNPHSPFDITEDSGAGEEDKNVDPGTPEVKKLEVDAVNAAQGGDFTASMELFNQAISLAPNYPSVYNNRAQLLRLQGDNEMAMEDLNKAIALSQGKGLAASQAFVQRGLLHQLNGSCEDYENDFRAAAGLGNSFAKNQLVAMNPYAALCNQMLGEVFSRVRNGLPDLS